MFNKLESLRGIAACLVILFHSPFKFDAQPFEFLTNCYLLVDMFFVLSGFVMSHAYADKIGHGLPFIDYMILRLGRLYPLHVFMLLAWLPYVLFKQYAFIHGMGGKDQFIENSVASFIANLLLLHSMGFTHTVSWNIPSWSIGAEFYTYIVFFVLLCTADSKRKFATPLLMATLGYGFFFLGLKIHNLNLTYDFGFVRCLAAFYLGVFIFRIRPFALRYLRGRLLNALELITAIAALLAVTFADRDPVFLQAAIISFALVLLVYSSPYSGILGKSLEAMPMRLLGLWSYSIYMTHKLILAVAANLFTYMLHRDLNQALGWWSPLINGAIFIIVIFISRLTYVHIEQRFRDRTKALVQHHRKLAA